MVAAHCRGPIPTPARAVVATNKIYPTHSEAERVRERFTKKVARLLDFVQMRGGGAAQIFVTFP